MSRHWTAEDDPLVLRARADHMAAGAYVLRAHSVWSGLTDTVATTSKSDVTHLDMRRLDRARAALSHAEAMQERAALGVAGAAGGPPPAGVGTGAPEPIRLAEQLERAALACRQRAITTEMERVA